MAHSNRFRDGLLPGLSVLFALLFFQAHVSAAPGASQLSPPAPPAAANATPEAEPIDPGSPRASVAMFFERCRTVETVGLRSTRIRTLDRTLIAIPNGKLSEMRIESYTMRDRMRLACDVGVVYDTDAGQMRAVLAGFERVLRAHPKIWEDTVVVRFKEFGDSALVIEVMAWFCTSNYDEFREIRQEILIEFMQVVAEAGTRFAFPTRTVHVVSEHAALGA
ncbi:MAG: mechanosensitive ion channel [Polyangiaceae bacterium]|nr:mechanosensitive ion channel [Polyangiaceae bacterium]